MMRVLSRFLVPTLLCFLTACASHKHPQDPLEPMNRSIYGFNRTIDKAIIRPVAYGYRKFMPNPIQIGVSNFYSNIYELPTIANDVLQMKFSFAANDGGRFLINSTVGLLGILDPATRMGLNHREEDFGQTMKKWGVKKSSYLVLPILGPSTVRDSFGMAVDTFAFSIWPHINSTSLRNSLFAVHLLDTRARLLKSEKVLDVVALDEYAVIRDAYYQHREYLASDEAVATDESDVSQEWDALDNLEEPKDAPLEEATVSKSPKV